MILVYHETEKLTVPAATSTDVSFSDPQRPILVAVSGAAAFQAKVGASPTADANSPYFPADDIHLFTVPAGESLALFITAGGTLWASRVSGS